MGGRLDDTEAIVRERDKHLGCGELSVGERLEGNCGPSNPNAGAARCASWGYRPNGPRNPTAGVESLKAASSYVRGGIR
jgi:hypothetical protein